MSDGTARRHAFYVDNERRLRQLAWRAMRRGNLLDGIVIVCIDVDDQAWTELADCLMPGHDWDAYRAKGLRPVARGSQPWALTEVLGAAVPDLVPVFREGPPPGHALAVVCAAGGASVYPVSPLEDHN